MLATVKIIGFQLNFVILSLNLKSFQNKYDTDGEWNEYVVWMSFHFDISIKLNKSQTEKSKLTREKYTWVNNNNNIGN
jgi:hypothetical protein